MTNVKINQQQAVAVATDYYLQPMSTCPPNVKVQLMNPGGVLCYGKWNGRDTCWQGWAPLPKRRREP